MFRVFYLPSLHSVSLCALLMEMFHTNAFSIHSKALDTASLLGGHEVMVAQLLADRQKRNYTDEDKEVINWALKHLWSAACNVDIKFESQSDFTNLIVPEVRSSLSSNFNNIF